MTSVNFSKDFLVGCSILTKYMQTDMTVSVAEASAIVIFGLKPISEDDIASLGCLNWDCGNNKENVGYASFHDLEYADY